MTPRYPPRSERPGAGSTAATARMGSLVAGGLGLLGFSLAIVFGLAANNALTAILWRAIVVAFTLAAIGGVVGSVAGRIIQEHLERAAGAVASPDAAPAGEARRQDGSRRGPSAEAVAEGAGEQAVGA